MNDNNCRITLFGVKYSHFVVFCLLTIAIIMCLASLAVTERSDSCTPYCENKYWIHYIKNLVKGKDMLLNQLRLAMNSNLWSRWVDYDKINESPQFTKMSHSEIVNKLHKSRCKLDEGKRSWKIFGLILNKQKIEPAYKICPKIIDELLKIPNIINAGFSCFEPGTQTDLHRGYNNKILRCHIPLIVPDGDTAIRVGFKKKNFKDIETFSGYFIFNDSCLHQAWNKTDKKRIVLIIDLKK